MSSGSFKNIIYKMCLEIIYVINMYKKDLPLNYLQRLICNETELNYTKPNQHLIWIFCSALDIWKVEKNWCVMHQIFKF